MTRNKKTNRYKNVMTETAAAVVLPKSGVHIVEDVPLVVQGEKKAKKYV